MEPRYDFASDNTAGLCPEALAALAEASKGCCASYGEDRYTARATDMIRELFEADCDVYFVFNGTAANLLALASMCRNYHSVVCYDTSHIETDECGAPEFFSNGTKILLTAGEDGKLDGDGLERMISEEVGYSLSQAAGRQPDFAARNLSSLYSPDEIRELASRARPRLRVRMDGARFADPRSPPRVFPRRSLPGGAGVDVLCLAELSAVDQSERGGGLFDRELSREFDYRCKQGGQLASAMRFASAPLGSLPPKRRVVAQRQKRESRPPSLLATV
jgi:threonine aldolase